jgi:hypothetical protein
MAKKLLEGFAKNKLIAEAIFDGLQISQKANEIFGRISDLASKMGKIKKQSHFIILNTPNYYLLI